MAAVPPAFGADVAALEMPCNQLLPDDPDLRLGQVIGAGPVGVLTDGPNCPGPAVACRTKASARPGQNLLLGRSRADYICAFDARTDSTGWLPQQRVATHPLDPAPPLAAWLGTWRYYDDKIVLKRAGEILDAEGEAYWPGKNVMPANEGAFAGTAKPAGNRLHFGDGAPGDEVVEHIGGILAGMPHRGGDQCLARRIDRLVPAHHRRQHDARRMPVRDVEHRAEHIADAVARAHRHPAGEWPHRQP